MGGNGKIKLGVGRKLGVEEEGKAAKKEVRMKKVILLLKSRENER